MDFFEIEMKKSSGVYTQSIKWKSKRYKKKTEIRILS